MVRQIYNISIAATLITIIMGCGEISNATSTHEATVSDTPEQTSTPLPQPETSTPSALPDFSLPEGHTPGRLLFDNRLGYALIRFSPDSKLVAVGYGTNIMLRDMATGQQTKALEYPPSYNDNSGVLDFEFSMDGNLLAVVYGAYRSYSGRLDMWDIAAGTFRSLTETHGPYNDVAFSPDGSRMALGPVYDLETETSGVEIWDVVGDVWIRQKILMDAKPGFVFSPDGKTLAALSGVDFMKSTENPGPPVLWDVATDARRELVVSGFPSSLAYSPDGENIAINTIQESGDTLDQIGTSLIDSNTGELRFFIKSVNLDSPAVTFSADGSVLIATYSSTNQAVLWDVQTGRQVLTLNAPVAGLGAPIVSPDGHLLAAISSSDGQIVFWNMPQ